MGDNRRETRWDGGREKGRQGKLVRRKTKRDRDEARHRRKERQRNLETLKQTGRQLSGFNMAKVTDQSWEPKTTSTKRWKKRKTLFQPGSRGKVR